MSPEERIIRNDGPIHERARNLAAESVDVELEPSEAAWLAGHLSACADCAAVADEYRAIHAELAALPLPEPPRDLWARTAAGFDMVDASTRRWPSSKTSQAGRRPLITTAVAVGVVVVVAAASLIVQSPIVNPVPGSTRTAPIALATTTPGQSSSSPQAPVAVVNGTSYWIASVAGVYEIKGGTTQCTATDASCTVSDGSGQTLGTISSTSDVSAAIAPDASRAAVWTDDNVVIMPLVSSPQNVAIDLLTPRPTPTAAPSKPAPSSTPTQTVTERPSVTAAISAVVPSLVATATPAPTATPTAAAPATPPSAGQATAILSGYQIVGRDPEFSADGNFVAFSARPVDHSTGPDVFVWRVGQERAQAVSSRHGDLFAGWFGRNILISEIGPVQTAGGAAATAASGTDSVGSTSYVLDPTTGKVLQIGQPMLLPAVDPTGQYLVYWSGSVEFDPISGLWQPGKGDLYFEAWSDLTLTPASLTPVPPPTATPAATVTVTPTPTPTPVPSLSPTPAPTVTAEATGSAEPSALASTPPVVPATTTNPSPTPTLPQLLPVVSGHGLVHGWVVRWDRTGRNVAVWVADAGSDKIGRLNLFSVDRTKGRVDTNEPRLAADKVMSTLTFDDGHLVYTSAVDGKTYMQAIPSVPPSTASTPSPTLPGQLATDGAVSGSPSPQATDRPGS